jgi:hypothetical protein
LRLCAFARNKHSAERENADAIAVLRRPATGMKLFHTKTRRHEEKEDKKGMKLRRQSYPFSFTSFMK